MKKIFLCIGIIILLSGCGNEEMMTTCTTENSYNGLTSGTEYLITYQDDEVKHVTITYNYNQEDHIDGVNTGTDGTTEDENVNDDNEIIDGVVGDTVDDIIGGVYNTILDETENFVVVPTLGSLVEGYVLIVSKHHIFNMGELSIEKQEEYINIVNKYRELFNKIYGKYPIVFEHGTSKNDINLTSSSVIHAHTHIVNHSFVDENKIINDLNFEEISEVNEILSDKNYILYISKSGKKYITYNFESTSQLMRILIAKDLGYENKYNWKNDTFLDNIEKTIEKLNYNKFNIEEKYLYELDINDTFFDSLRCDYKGFDEWFKRNNKRKVYVTFNDRKITSFLMLKEEINEKYNFELNEERILKICTMKVVNNGVGIGEEFIKIIFNRAKESGIKKIYFTVYPKYTDLISFFSKYDFKYYSTKKTINNNDEINDEYVYVRDL